MASDRDRQNPKWMKSYLLKPSGHEEGPYEETQVAQMFADGRVDRNTPCKPADRGDWKSVDDYLPMLKYGTQLPPPTQIRDVPAIPPPAFLSQRVSVVDFDIPFWSVLKIVFKWMAAAFIVACCFLPFIIVFWLIVMTVFAGLIGGAFSNFHHP
jgi:hypothetical protein